MMWLFRNNTYDNDNNIYWNLFNKGGLSLIRVLTNYDLQEAENLLLFANDYSNTGLLRSNNQSIVRALAAEILCSMSPDEISNKSRMVTKDLASDLTCLSLEQRIAATGVKATDKNVNSATKCDIAKDDDNLDKFLVNKAKLLEMPEILALTRNPLIWKNEFHDILRYKTSNFDIYHHIILNAVFK